MRQTLLAFAFVVMVLARPSDAIALTGRGNEIAQVGERAYAAGEYGFAIQAFEVAYGMTRRAALLFSIAQSHRQLAALERGSVAEAVRLYRRYLAAAPRGAHAAEARLALRELTPRLRSAATLPERRTRVGLISNVLGGRGLIDGRRPRKLPTFVEVAPGKHRLVIRAPHYQPVVRVVRLKSGTLYARRIALRPMPAKLAITGPNEAKVHVDGKLAGALPFEEALELEPGTRLVAVTRNGYHPHAEEVVLRRGKLTKLEIDLEMTAQRKAAWPLVAVGAAGVAAGIVLGVFAVVSHREAIDLQDAGGDPLEYDALIEARDDFRLGSGIAAGTGFGLFLIGGGLLVFDTPPLPTRVTGGTLNFRF